MGSAMIALAFLAFSSLLKLTQGQGQVVVGGVGVNGRLSSVELFPPSDACSIPDLPQGRSGPSLSLLSGGRLVVCGGHDGSSFLDSCNSWVAGDTSWTPFHTMSVTRNAHTAWTPPSLPDSIVLLGGYGNAAELTAETVPGGGGFDLSHSGARSCGIPDAGDTIVLTGGIGHNYVTRYDIHGFMEELPQLPENRHGHACSALPATGGFVVAGGYTSGYTSSVLTLLPGVEAWTPLASLPQPLVGAPASIVGGKLRVTGGRGHGNNSEVLEYHPEPLNQWSLIGHLQSGKSHHAVLSVGSQQLPCFSTDSGCASQICNFSLLFIALSLIKVFNASRE